MGLTGAIMYLPMLYLVLYHQRCKYGVFLLQVVSPRPIAEGDEPVISPSSDKVAFIKSGQVWASPLDASSTAEILFTTRGTNSAVEWSPNGSQLAFVSNRGDHALVGVYTNKEAAINWLAPSFARDRSPDGRKIVFVRTPGDGGVLVRQHRPWAIWAAEVTSG
ncbi:TolB family protein [Pontibacter silvestris]|uniref:TolB family protein n=1 Tax=Pontibacter silvestris TaxID=2305183 RepID=A0ABW4WZF7_9BACT|nr:hypothetical protein [Pontibacter silvestris]